MLTSLLYLFNIQEVVEGIIDAALKTNPYNAAAYGVLVAVLMLFAFMNYRDRRRADKALIKHMEESISIFTKLEEPLSLLREIKTMLKMNQSNQDR